MYSNKRRRRETGVCSNVLIGAVAAVQLNSKPFVASLKDPEYVRKVAETSELLRALNGKIKELGGVEFFMDLADPSLLPYDDLKKETPTLCIPNQCGVNLRPPPSHFEVVSGTAKPSVVNVMDLWAVEEGELKEVAEINAGPRMDRLRSLFYKQTEKGKDFYRLLPALSYLSPVNTAEGSKIFYPIRPFHEKKSDLVAASQPKNEYTSTMPGIKTSGRPDYKVLSEGDKEEMHLTAEELNKCGAGIALLDALAESLNVPTRQLVYEANMQMNDLLRTSTQAAWIELMLEAAGVSRESFHGSTPVTEIFNKIPEFYSSPGVNPEDHPYLYFVRGLRLARLQRAGFGPLSSGFCGGGLTKGLLGAGKTEREKVAWLSQRGASGNRTDAEILADVEKAKVNVEKWRLEYDNIVRTVFESVLDESVSYILDDRRILIFSKWIYKSLSNLLPNLNLPDWSPLAEDFNGDILARDVRSVEEIVKIGVLTDSIDKYLRNVYFPLLLKNEPQMNAIQIPVPQGCIPQGSNSMQAQELHVVGDNLVRMNNVWAQTTWKILFNSPSSVPGNIQAPTFHNKYRDGYKALPQRSLTHAHIAVHNRGCVPGFEDLYTQGVQLLGSEDAMQGDLALGPNGYRASATGKREQIGPIAHIEVDRNASCPSEFARGLRMNKEKAVALNMEVVELHHCFKADRKGVYKKGEGGIVYRQTNPEVYRGLKEQGLLSYWVWRALGVGFIVGKHSVSTLLKQLPTTFL